MIYINIYDLYQQKESLQIPEVVDQQDFSNSSVLKSLTQSLEVMQRKKQQDSEMKITP